MDLIQLPVKEIDGKKWILLNDLDSKVIFRAEAVSKVERVKEPSDHRVFQVVGEFLEARE